MPGLQDNLRRWRDVAEIDWFSQFIKAWIPFNAWMTDTFGDLTDRELMDKVKAGSNVVYNRILPMLSKGLPQAPGTQVGWQDGSPDAQQFRSQIEEIHRLLESCVIEGRRGRISFETVDIGANLNKEEQRNKWNRNFQVRRDHPAKPQVTLEISATKTTAAFALTLSAYDKQNLQDAPCFQTLRVDHRATLLAMFDAVAPRKIVSVLAQPGYPNTLKIGNTVFINDPVKLFGALVDVIYCLRNALFHGSITPNSQHNEIYKPAYNIVMRLVKCTI